MNAKLTIAVLAMSLAAPAVAETIGVGDLVNKLWEDAARKAVTDAVTETIKGGIPANKQAEKHKPTKNAAGHALGRAGGNDFAFLPLTGNYRFAMPKGGDPKNIAIGPRGGYVDRFGNEWVPLVDSPKEKRRVLMWQEYFSGEGRFRLKSDAQGKEHILIGLDGKVR